MIQREGKYKKKMVVHDVGSVSRSCGSYFDCTVFVEHRGLILLRARADQKGDWAILSLNYLIDMI